MAYRACVVGGLGKMGNKIANLLLHDKFFEKVIRVDPLAEATPDWYKSLKKVDPTRVDVVIDFSNPKTALETARWCAKYEIPLVSGTTGLTQKQIVALHRLADKTAILYDTNMSSGINVLDALLPQILNALPGFVVEIIDIHDEHKKDSPSGTALHFAQTLINNMGGEVKFGRPKSDNGNRPPAEIVLHSIRGGTVPSTHIIHLIGPDEMIEIRHSALSFKIFALGAIKAAKWIVKESSGFYTMKDVLEV